ncbi:purine-nucleoside phosphorylase [Salimicrobium jeotgali]|uniref:Purine nucleoside phosphorylase n=2 Tax=Salimicrobium TaxID=351195 RepID=K2GKX9_9BACI|nr:MULTISPECIES: purine-nucleoside phosphorylase [Salimicrobium]AKG04370.1 purine-nucleoside phosphorylase [Salimicrobium jeotgali]EKE31039.1 purine nucleoside phosphorylase [Salimicrobium jeotgali]MBM7697478.1 purine-nucleoside phosphorylase [Salimicrobium jeotgali]SIS55185.1 purine-nucleoside phosphorylase [Salimicrobium salexigens]
MNTEAVKEAAAFIEGKLDKTPAVGLILGSGLGVLADEITNPVTIPYKDVPHFPESTVSGHKGQLVIGELEGKQVIAMQGRFHYYEGYTMKEVTFPVRVMKSLGISDLFVTNAAGGINESYEPGQLMIIKDHINQMGDNPLIGPNDDSMGVRFPDMSEAYNRTLIETAQNKADALGLKVEQGVYVGNTGPVYETAAEIRMLRTLGGDAVGMSTVPEVIAANHAGLRVLGISCISNMAAGILDQPLTHDEVIETTARVREDFLSFVKAVVKAV